MDDRATAHLLASSRARKSLYWLRVRREPIPDQVVEQIIRSGVWHQWGYRRLGDLLMREVGLTAERAADWTCRAIEGGYEDASAYGC